jgi:hypothetical protein
MSKGDPQDIGVSRPDILGQTIIGSFLVLVILLVVLHVLLPGV